MEILRLHVIYYTFKATPILMKSRSIKHPFTMVLFSCIFQFSLILIQLLPLLLLFLLFPLLLLISLHLSSRSSPPFKDSLLSFSSVLFDELPWGELFSELPSLLAFLSCTASLYLRHATNFS